MAHPAFERAVLVVDVGGTHTRIARLHAEAGGPRLTEERWYPSAGSPGLEPLLKRWLDASDLGFAGLAGAGIAVAGPVEGDRAWVSNLDWHVHTAAIRAETGLEHVALLNDFAAVALGASEVPAERCAVLQANPVDPAAPRAIVGAGTGLGEAIVVPGGGGAPDRVLASEGGHADYAPQTPAQDALLVWLRARYGAHVSVERVVSGQGLGDTFRWACEAWPERVRPEAAEALRADTDLAAFVSTHADADALCAEVLDLFLFSYGAEAGNLALKCLPRGGVFLAGGIAPRLVERMRAPEGAFLTGFNGKGRFERLLRALPITVLLEPRVGLFGAGRAALDLAR
jgi:glucokinase